MNRNTITILIFAVLFVLSIWWLSPSTTAEYGKAAAYPVVIAAIYYFTQKPTTA